MKNTIFKTILILGAVAWVIIKSLIVYYADFVPSPGLMPTYIKDSQIFLDVLSIVLPLGFIVEFFPILKNLKAALRKLIPHAIKGPVDFDIKDKNGVLKQLLINSKRRCGERIAEINTIISLGNKKPLQLPSVSFTNFDNFFKDKNFIKDDDYDIERNVVSFAIVGNAGSGKSYRLLNLINNILDKYFPSQIPNESLRIPIFLELSNWNKELNPFDSIEDFAISEIKESYNIVSSHAEWLVREQKVILCLDGLDEVTFSEREQCLKAILDYTQKTNLVFSCRNDDLLFIFGNGDIIDKFHFVGVEKILPLDKDTVGSVINSNQNFYKKNVLTVVNDYDLWEHLDSALKLNLFLSQFNSISEDELREILLPIDSSEDQKQADSIKKDNKNRFLNLLWGKYDKQQFHSKLKTNSKGKKRQPALIRKEKRIRTFTASIAQLIDGNSFYIEKLQPYSWLKLTLIPENPWQGNLRRVSYYLITRVITTVLLGVATGLIIAEPLTFLGCSILLGVVITFVTFCLNRWEEKHLSTLVSSEQTEHDIKLKKKYNRIVYVFFILLLIVVSGFYQALTVPRAEKDMLGPFSVTESYSGILFGLISGFFFSYRKREQNKFIDIRPVEKFSFDFKNAWSGGWRGALLVGSLIGFFGVLVKTFFNQTSIYPWLKKYLSENEIFTHSGARFIDLDIWQNIILFTFAFGVAAPIGFLIFSIISGLNSIDVTQSSDIREKVRRLNYGIKRSFLYSLYWLGLITTISTILYSIFILYIIKQSESFPRAIMIGSGLGIISFLWFGGFEVISHWTLRLILYLKGTVPLRLFSWSRQMANLAFIKQKGANLNFIHATLGDYFKSLPFNSQANELLTNISKPTLRLTILAVFSLICFIFLALPIWYRFNKNHFWQHPDEFIFHISLKEERKINDSTLLILENGELKINASGTVKVGTFLGHIKPSGTISGFFGFPVRDVFNVDPNLRHGIVLYNISSSSKTWKPLNLDFSSFFVPDIATTRCVVQKGDTIYFAINDNEYQNNSGHFLLDVSISSDNLNKKK